MTKYIFIILSLLSFSVQSEALEVLTVDRIASNNIELFFPNDNDIKPRVSDFVIVNYVLMSNEAGGRWGVITLTNSSSGNRELVQDYLMALFADGSRSNPLEYKLNFKGKETKSITVSFGYQKFPILSIYSRNKI